MPNETNNTLLIRGDKGEIAKFIQLHKTEIEGNLYWDFRKSIPSNPDNFIQNWGTHRIGIMSLSDDTNGIVMFETPLTPCFTWFKSIVSQYPQLNFSYYYSDEFQEEFYGWAVAYNGKILDGKQICLHPDENVGGIDLFKYDDFRDHFKKIRESN